MNTGVAQLKAKEFYNYYLPPDNYSHASILPIKQKKSITYPERDGEAMADNTLQFSWIVKIKEGFEILFENDPDIFVAGDLLWYPVEGDNKICAAPDTMIVFGRPKGYRGSYRTWDEANINPQVTFEILSPGNTKQEMGKKLQFYEQHKVEEYYVYDPDHIIFSAWIRSGEKLCAVENTHGWSSPLLNVRFEIINNELQIFTPDGKKFLSPVEINQRAEAESKRADAESKRADAEYQRAEALSDKLRKLGHLV